MSLIGDLVKVAEYLEGFLGKKKKTDHEFFLEVIDPLYIQLEHVVIDSLKLYEPTGEALFEIIHETVDAHNKEIEVIWEEFHGSDSKKYDDNGRSYEERTNEVKLKHSESFPVNYGERMRSIYNDFKKSRRDTRDARLRVDAAAYALMEVYENRDDDFARRVKELCSRVRVIVGRAHVDPLQASRRLYESRTTSFEEDMRRAFSYQLPAFEIDEDAQSVIDTQEAELDESLSNEVVFRDSLSHLIDGITGICGEIRGAWDDVLYLYGLLRLSVISSRVGQIPPRRAESSRAPH